MNQRKAHYGHAVASTYEQRWDASALQGIADALVNLARQSRAQRVLEAGCGTGRWVRELAAHSQLVVGVDASLDMLRHNPSLHRACAAANALPFAARAFDMIYCVNAIHHFDNGAGFISDCSGLLRKGGLVCVIGIDPRVIGTRYFYDYFEGSREIDAGRYPSFGQIAQWTIAAGFQPVEYRVVETYVSRFKGDEVFSDVFLRKDSNSLLNVLTDAEYNQGLDRIRNVISSAKAAGTEVAFNTELPFGMVTGTLPT